MVSRQDIDSMIQAAMLDRKCRADWLHIGRLRYTGGPGGYYICECGMRYRKDGRGGLVEIKEETHGS